VTVDEKIVADLVANQVEFVTTVPCKQLAGVIDKIDAEPSIYHIPSNKEDEGMGLCAGAFMGGKRPAIIMQNTAIGVTINTLVTLTQYYRMPLPMIISYRGELGEPVACQVEMAVHTKALLAQLNIPTYHFHHEDDVNELDNILKGLSSSIGLGLALAQKQTVISIDGDGSVLTNLGTLPTIANNVADNFILLIIDNGSYGSTGDQPTYAGKKTSLTAVAEACGCENVIECRAEETKAVVEKAIESKQMTIIVSKCESGNVKVPVITMDPVVIRDRFMKALAAKNA